MRLLSISLLWTAILLTGCSQGDLPDYDRLGSLRILSLKVDQPEVAPGTSVTITPYISDLNGQGRTLNFRAFACTDPGIARGLDPSCDEALDRIDVQSGTITPGAPPNYKAPNYTGAAPSISLTVPSTLLDAKSTFEKQLGIDYLLFYELKGSDGTSLQSFKRIHTSLQTQKNTNPTFVSIQTGGANLVALPTSTVSLTPLFSPTSKETYTVLRTDGSSAIITESLLVTWFISDGSLDYTRTVDTDANPFSPPSPPPSSHSTILIGVVRDGRGGEDVVQLEL
jgi:hypothetical protein